MVIVPGRPPKHAEGYTCMCTIITTVQAILPYKRAVMSESRLVYINTLSPIVDCFPKSTVTLDVESTNGWFITLASALFTGLTVKMTPYLCMYCVCIYATFRNSVIRLQNVA